MTINWKERALEAEERVDELEEALDTFVGALADVGRVTLDDDGEEQDTEV
jgi:hypothetical protein